MLNNKIKEIILIIFFLSSSPLKYAPLVTSESTTIMNRSKTDNLTERFITVHINVHAQKQIIIR